MVSSPILKASLTPVWRMIVGCQKPIAYDPISMPNKIVPISHTRGLVNTERMVWCVFAPASSLISATTMAFSSVGQPFRIDYPVIETKQNDDAENDRGYGFENEKPLPSRDTLAAGKMVQNIAGERAADDPGDWDSGHQQCHHLGPPMRWEPVGEIENHAREKSGLRDAEQKADWCRTPMECAQGQYSRNDSPGNKHSADPDPRAQLVKDDVARNLEQEISKEKDAGAESIYAVTEFQVAHHLQFGKADIHPVEISDDVAEEQNRHNPPGDLAIKRAGSGHGGDVRCGVMCL